VCCTQLAMPWHHVAWLNLPSESVGGETLNLLPVTLQLHELLTVVATVGKELQGSMVVVVARFQVRSSDHCDNQY
jgi:hypothetical protein